MSIVIVTVKHLICPSSSSTSTAVLLSLRATDVHTSIRMFAPPLLPIDLPTTVMLTEKSCKHTSVA